MKLKITRLDLSWSVSRGRYTQGYNICRLDDCNTGKRYKCMGGGYDMVGTVFADYLNDVHQARLVALFKSRTDGEDAKYQIAGYKKIKGLYGITLTPDDLAYCDGPCGVESMINIARAAGMEVEKSYNRRAGKTTGFIVSEQDVEEAT